MTSCEDDPNRGISLPDTPIRCKDHHHRTRGQDISIKKKKKKTSSAPPVCKGR